MDSKVYTVMPNLSGDLRLLLLWRSTGAEFFCSSPVSSSSGNPTLSLEGNSSSWSITRFSIDPEEHSGLPFCSGDGSNACTSSDAVSVSDSNDGPELLLWIESSCWCWSSTAPSLGWGLPSVMLTSRPSSDSLPSAPEPVDLPIPGDAVFCRGHLVANSELPHSASLLLLVISKPAGLLTDVAVSSEWAVILSPLFSPAWWPTSSVASFPWSTRGNASGSSMLRCMVHLGPLPVLLCTI